MLNKEEQVYNLLTKAPEDQDKSIERQTVTRRVLARAVQSACDGFAQSQAAMIVDQMLEEIADALVRGEQVTLCNFGKFVVVEKKERKGRDPRTGGLATIKRRKVASFRPSKHMRSVIYRHAPC